MVSSFSKYLLLVVQSALHVIHFDVNGFRLSVVLNGLSAAFASDSAPLVAAEREFHGWHVVIVDPNGTAFQAIRYSMRPLQIPAQKRCKWIYHMWNAGTTDVASFLKIEHC